MLWSWIALAGLAVAGPAELLGVWSNETGKVEISGDASGHLVRLNLRGDMVQQGQIREEDGSLQAAMDGCGATLALTNEGRLNVDLGGPECPIELIGEYVLAAPPKAATHCADIGNSQFNCVVPGKKGGAAKRLEVCKVADGTLHYKYGALGNVELSLKNGKQAERALASGMEYSFSFNNEGYNYNAFVVESSRADDTGAGVAVSKDGKTVATLTCGNDEWFRATDDAPVADQVCCKTIQGPPGDAERYSMRFKPRADCETTTAEIGTASECEAFKGEVICCATTISRGKYSYEMNSAGECFKSSDNSWAKSALCE